MDLNGKNIRIACLDNMGDVLNSTVLIGPLKQAFPDAHLSYWVKEHLPSMLENDPLIDAVHGASPFWTGSPNRPAGSVGDYLGMLCALRRQRYDVAIIANTCWRKALSLLFVPCRLGLDRKRSRLLLTHAVAASLLPDEHSTSAYGRLLECMGVPHAGMATRLFPQPGYAHWCAAFAERHLLANRRVIALQLYSGDARKDLPETEAAAVVEAMGRLYDARVLVVFGPGDEGRARAAVNGLPNAVIEPTGLAELTMLLSRVNLFIGPDSGPLHIASSLGRPTLAFYTHTRSSWSRPLGAGPARFIETGATVDGASILREVEGFRHLWGEAVWSCS